MAKRNDDFSNKIGRNLQKQKEDRKGYGYLDLPKGIEPFVVDEGVREVSLDFLPYEVSDAKHPDRDPQFDIAMPGSLWYRRPFKVHRNVGANNETVVCPKSVGKPCPICDYQKKRMNEKAEKKRMNEKAEKEEIVELYAKPRSLYAVIPIGMRKIEEKVHIWDMSDKLFQEILNDDLSLHPENLSFPSLSGGKTAILTLKWKNLGKVTYPEVRAIDFEERDAYSEKILDEVPDLDKMLRILSYEQIEAKFFETEEEETGGALHEVEERPRRHVEREEEKEEAPPRRRRAENQEREEPPQRSRRSRAEEPEKELERKRKATEEFVPQRGSAEGEYNSSADTTPVERPRRNRAVEEKTTDRCPYGHVFGEDAEKFNDCDICKIWKECIEETEKK